jgi:hypothetical protein
MKRMLAILTAIVFGGLGVAIASFVPQAAEAGFKVN